MDKGEAGGQLCCDQSSRAQQHSYTVHLVWNVSPALYVLKAMAAPEQINWLSETWLSFFFMCCFLLLFLFFGKNIHSIPYPKESSILALLMPGKNYNP